jgi:hypothetical protein
MQNAVYPGRQPVPIARARPVILRYRVVLHRGELTPADMERLQSEYAGERIADSARQLYANETPIRLPTDRM